jgi:hypothetical protein
MNNIDNIRRGIDTYLIAFISVSAVGGREWCLES